MEYFQDSFVKVKNLLSLKQPFYKNIWKKLKYTKIKNLFEAWTSSVWILFELLPTFRSIWRSISIIRQVFLGFYFSQNLGLSSIVEVLSWFWDWFWTDWPSRLWVWLQFLHGNLPFTVKVKEPEKQKIN